MGRNNSIIQSLGGVQKNTLVMNTLYIYCLSVGPGIDQNLTVLAKSE